MRVQYVLESRWWLIGPLLWGEPVTPPASHRFYLRNARPFLRYRVRQALEAADRVPLEKIVRDRKWQQMSAVREGRVYCISDELLNTPVPTLVSGLHALAAAIHPDAFPQPEGLRCINGARARTDTRQSD